MTSSPAPVQPGDVLAGKYRVEALIGQGGMGVVVAATHLQLGQRVAIKFLIGDAMHDGILVERFLREGRTMVQLRSEHVTRVSDVGTLETGAPYLVMELLEGQDLSQLVEARGRLAASEAVDYVLQAAEAVAEAHSLQIVHRDLKPSNLFLTRRRDGSSLIKVLDFGISKSHDTSGSKLTMTTQIMGSPAYMSPEQVQSATGVDHRSDVWSLGVILYELLAGIVPFNATTVPGMFASIVAHAHVPLTTRCPDVDPGLALALDGALAKDVNQRFQSLADFAHALLPYAPSGSRGTVDRISRLLGAPELPRSLPPTAQLPAAARTATSSTTTSSQVLTSIPPMKPMKKGWQLPMIALAVALVVGLGVTLWVSSSREGPSLAAQSEGIAPAASQTPAAPPTVSPVTTPEPPLKAAVVVEPAPSAAEPAPSVAAKKPLSMPTKTQRNAQTSSPTGVKKKAPLQPSFDPLSDGR